MPRLFDDVQGWFVRTWGEEWGSILVLNAVANTLLFVPVGVLAYLLFPRRAWALALLVSPIACGLSELVQANFLADRVADIADVIAATAGGTIGVALAALFTLVIAWRRTSRRAIPPQSSTPPGLPG